MRKRRAVPGVCRLVQLLALGQAASGTAPWRRPGKASPALPGAAAAGTLPVPVR